MKSTNKSIGNQTKIYGLLKFGEEQHIKNLFENGELYFGAIKKFKKGVEENDRYDSYEGTEYLINSLPGVMQIKISDEKSIEGPYKKIHLAESSKNLTGNICCFYSITTENHGNGKGIQIDEEMKKFGEYVILIYDTQKFIELFRIALDKLKIDAKLGLVKYYDESKFSGKLTFHHKRKRYNYQYEYRIFLETEFTEPYTMHLGSLQSIAMIGKSDDIEKLEIIPLS